MKMKWNLSVIVQKILNAIYSVKRKSGVKIDDEFGAKKGTKFDLVLYPLFIW